MFRQIKAHHMDYQIFISFIIIACIYIQLYRTLSEHSDLKEDVFASQLYVT